MSHMSRIIYATYQACHCHISDILFMSHAKHATHHTYRILCMPNMPDIIYVTYQACHILFMPHIMYPVSDILFTPHAKHATYHVSHILFMPHAAYDVRHTYHITFMPHNKHVTYYLCHVSFMSHIIYETHMASTSVRWHASIYFPHDVGVPKNYKWQRNNLLCVLSPLVDALSCYVCHYCLLHSVYYSCI